MNLYSKISTILKEIDENKISFKNAIYKHAQKDNDKHFKTIYKLVIETLKNKKLIQDIIDTFFQDKVNDNYYFMVLIYERYFSNQKKKKMGGKLIKMLKDKEKEIQNYISYFNIQNVSNLSKKENEIEDKMYFRLNLQSSREDKCFDQIFNKDEIIEGLYYICKKQNSDLIQNVFDLKEKSDIIIQSKSSCLPAYILKRIVYEKENKSFFEKLDILDSCSAPGNKTLQLAEYFYNEGSNILAFEINDDRYKLLCDNIDKYNFYKNIIPMNKDFLSIDPNDKKYKNVKVILADPSCSGSGTAHNSLIDSIDKNLDQECCVSIAGSYVEKEQINRLTKLASFQMKIIQHCIKFPNVKYISYSTCSIFMTENEFVVNKILKNNPNFILVNIFDKIEELKFFHKGITPNTEETLRACRKCNKIDGFYVAIFQKI